MIFSTDMIKKQENINESPEVDLLNTNIQNSLFLESLVLLADEDRLFLENFNMIESVNEGIITDYIGKKITDKVSGSFDKLKRNFTIENILKFIVESIIKIINRLWKEFNIICMNIVSKGSQIKRFKKEISLLGEDIYIPFPFYTYSNIRNSNSRVDIEHSLNEEFNKVKDSLDSITKMNSVEATNAINKMTLDDYDIEFCCDSLRRDLLGTNKNVSNETFATELFRYFRNNETEPYSDVYIMADKYHKILNDYLDGSKTIKGCQRDKEKLESATNKLIKQYDSLNMKNFYNTYSDNKLDAADAVLKGYIKKIKAISNIYVLYFSSRLDAAKEEFNTNAKILFEVCKYIVREGK